MNADAMNVGQIDVINLQLQRIVSRLYLNYLFVVSFKMDCLFVLFKCISDMRITLKQLHKKKSGLDQGKSTTLFVSFTAV